MVRKYPRKCVESLRRDRDLWKETAEIAGDSKVMRSIEISLNEISSGKSIPLSQL